MTDKLRAAAQAALDLIEHDNRYCTFAAGILKDALAEPAIKESLTQRPWVGLTDEEITQGNRESLVDLQAWKEAVSWVEAKLREKNT